MSRNRTPPNPRARRFAIEDLFNIRLFLSSSIFLSAEVSGSRIFSGDLVHCLGLLGDHFAQQCADIENQSHAAVVEDGGSRDSGRVAKKPVQRLDDGLAFSQQRFDGDSGIPAVAMNDDHVLSLRASVWLAKYFAQPDIRQWLPAQAQDADGLAGNLFCRKLQALADHLEWNDVRLVVGNNGEAVDDGQSEGQANGDGCALAFGALNLDIASQEFDIASHHIHADAAP